MEPIIKSHQVNGHCLLLPVSMYKFFFVADEGLFFSLPNTADLVLLTSKTPCHMVFSHCMFNGSKVSKMKVSCCYHTYFTLLFMTESK